MATRKTTKRALTERSKALLLSKLAANRPYKPPMTTRKLLSDENVRKLKPAPEGKRYDVWDTLVPHMSVRVTETGAKSFVLREKVPGKKGRARLQLGAYPTLNVSQARAKARRFLAHIAEGVDPRLAERREQAQAMTLGDAVDQWLALKVRGKQRKAPVVERELRTYVLPVWGSLPVGSITRADVKQLITNIRDHGVKGDGAPYAAHAVLGHLRLFFEWVVDEERFGLAGNPAAGIKPAKFIGAKKARQRVLSDEELRAFWHAADQISLYGPLLKLLLLTGVRNSEAREARWPEFDLDKGLWRVPEERFKSGSEHLVALSSEAVALLRGLPRFSSGDFLFTSSFGRKPVYGLSKAKEYLDRKMRAELGELRPFVVHDLRRTVRTRLASLRVPDEVAEMCLGHGRKGLQRVYDLHHYEPEMRDAMERWAKRLMSIVTPPSDDNVVPLREAAK